MDNTWTTHVKFTKIGANFDKAFEGFDRCFESAEGVVDYADNLLGNIFSGRSKVEYRTVDNGVEVKLPGVGKENIDVIDGDNTVNIKWKDKSISKDHEDSITVRVPIHTEVKAEYNDGVLKVTFKRITKKKEGKKIKVS